MPLHVLLNEFEPEPNGSYISTISISVQSFQVNVETEQMYVKILIIINIFTR